MLQKPLLLLSQLREGIPFPLLPGLLFCEYLIKVYSLEGYALFNAASFLSGEMAADLPSLPPELKRVLVHLLPPAERCRLACTCRTFRTIVQSSWLGAALVANRASPAALKWLKKLPDCLTGLWVALHDSSPSHIVEAALLQHSKAVRQLGLVVHNASSRSACLTGLCAAPECFATAQELFLDSGSEVVLTLVGPELLTAVVAGAFLIKQSNCPRLEVLRSSGWLDFDGLESLRVLQLSSEPRTVSRVLYGLRRLPLLQEAVLEFFTASGEQVHINEDVMVFDDWEPGPRLASLALLGTPLRMSLIGAQRIASLPHLWICCASHDFFRSAVGPAVRGCTAAPGLGHDIHYVKGAYEALLDMPNDVVPLSKVQNGAQTSLISTLQLMGHRDIFEFGRDHLLRSPVWELARKSFPAAALFL